MAGSYIDQRLFAKDVQGPRLGNQKQTVNTYGGRIPTVYGKYRTNGSLIWATKFHEHEHEEGGKGGGGGVTTYEYTCSFAIALCEGEVTGLGRVWFDGTVVENFADILNNLKDGPSSVDVKIKGASAVLYRGTETQMPNSLIEGYEGAGNVPAYRGISYLVFNELNLKDFGNRIPQVSVEVSAATTKLCNIIKDIVAKSGISATEVNFTPFEHFSVDVPGYAIASTGTYRAAIEPLQLAYFFDMIETQGVIRCIARGSGETVAIDADYLGAYENNTPVSLLKTERGQELDLPKTVMVSYTNANKDYETASLESIRVCTGSKNRVSVNVPIAITNVLAADIAEKTMMETWIGRTNYQLQLPMRYAYVAPGHIITATANNKSITALVTKTSFGKPGLVKVEALETGQSVYVDSVPTIGEDTETVPSDDASAVTLRIMDTNSVIDDVVPYRPLAAVHGNPFYGATILKSGDGGVTYTNFTSIRTRAVMGTADTALAAGQALFWDMANTVDVTIFPGGTLSSATEIAVLNGTNTALLGAEIIQFTTATLIAANKYRLSGLLRGRRGTDTDMGSHTIGEAFTLLTQTTIEHLPLSNTSMGVRQYYRVGPATATTDDEIYQNVSFTHTGNAYKPYAPCHVKAERDSSGNLTITWIRRTRIGGTWLDYSDVQLGEESEKYQVDIMGGETVKRTIATTAPSATYSAAEQTADFGSPQSSVAIRVYQISAVRGKGYTKEVTV